MERSILWGKMGTAEADSLPDKQGLVCVRP
jgi:hypothetical protein